MPLGAARAGTVSKAPAGFDPFDLIAAVTAATNGGSVSTIITNTLTFATGSRIFAVSGGPSTTARTFSDPTPNWGSPAETWAEHVDDTLDVGGNKMAIGVASATAQAGRTTETVDVIWSGTLFNMIGGFFECAGPTIIRQVSPVATVSDTTTSITTTFAASPLVTSQILTVVGQRVNTDTIVVPTDFTLIFNASGNTNSRMNAAARIGHASTGVTWTGLSSSALAKLARSIELARPGQEL